MNTRNHFKLRFLRAALMLTLAVMTFPTEAWAEKIPYAVLSDEGKTLTFKYEEHTLGSNEWDVSNTVGVSGNEMPGWYNDYHNSITKVVFEASFTDARPKSCYGWFKDFSYLTTITDLKNLNTSEVTDMGYMFNGCSGLTSLDLSNFNTVKVLLYNMRHMFDGCSGLKSLCIGKDFTVNDEPLTNFMFEGCDNLAAGMLIVNGTTAPSIAQDNFFNVFTNGTLATNLTAAQLGASGPEDGLYTWKGGKFKSVGKVKIPYIDENGKLHDDSDSSTDDDNCAEALPITSSSNGATYGAGWYFVAGNVTINGQLMFTGDAHIILCDGAKLTVGTSESPVSKTNGAVFSYDAKINIYGQSSDAATMGSLTVCGTDYGIFSQQNVIINGGQVIATGNTHNGIVANDIITINGGQVTATGGDEGIYSTSVTINGGQVTATGGDEGIYSTSVTINGGQVTATGGNYGIESDINVTINGGQVTATNVNTDSDNYGIKSISIILGWTNADDFIKASSYNATYIDYVRIQAGKRFVAYNPVGEGETEMAASCIIGDASSTTATAIGTDISLTDATAAKTIAGKTLKPLNGYTVSTTDGNISLKNGTTAKNVDFTITTGTGSEAVTTSYYIYPASISIPATITLGYSGEVPEGYTPVYTATKTSDGTDVSSTVISGSTLTMPAYDVTITAEIRPTAYAVLSEDGTTLTFKCGVHTLAATNEWDVSNTGTSIPGWCPTDLSSSINSITTVEFDESFADARPKSCNHWFYFLINLTTIKGLNYLNTSEVTDMNSMFCLCQKLTSLDLSSFNTSKVTDMAIMFQLCRNLTNLDLSSFDTSNVKRMFNMFNNCQKLTSLTIGSGFTIGSGTSTTDMFSGCTNIANGMLIVNGTYENNTLKPRIAQDIFEGVFTNGTLATNLTAEQLGASGPDGDGLYTWKGGKFKSVGKVKIPYIDENGKLHDDDGTKTPDDPTDDCAEALPITSANSDVEYAGGWYFVTGDVTINGKLEFTGDAHIILCDGAKMTVTNTYRTAINNSAGNIIIYGQSTGDDMGSLNAIGFYGIFSTRDVIIYGGKVTANAEGESSMSIAASNVYIYGGQVTATATGFDSTGILCNGSTGISIQWTNENDYIMASSYYIVDDESSVKANKPFVVYNGETAGDVISGTLDADQISAIEGKTLRPAIVATVTTTAGTQLFSIDATNTTDAAALQAAVTAANAATSDVTLKLYKDVDLGKANVTFNNTRTVGEGESARPVAITLDLNAKTLSGTYTNVTYDDIVVCVKENTSLTITNNGNSGGITAEAGYCIRNIGTLTLNGSPTLTSNWVCISNNGGTLTLNGSPTLTCNRDCISTDGTLTLNGQTTFNSGNNWADIYVGEGKKIGIGTDFAVANNSKIKVHISSSNDFPYIFTRGYGANVKSGGDVIAPDDIFVCIKDDGHIATPTFQLVGEGDAAEAQACLQDPIQVAYIDANGKLHDNADGQDGTEDDMAQAYKLTGTETLLGKHGEETWYVTDFGTASSMTYFKGIDIDGTVHIILADGKHMKIGNSVDNPTDDNKGFSLTWEGEKVNACLNFYSQSDDANACGKFSVYSKYDAIMSYSVTINGGIIEAHSTNSDGISADNAVTINGGQVTATGGTNGKGIYAGHDITLGWRNADDFINASSYSGTVKIADGQYFTYEGNTGGALSGTLTADQVTAIAGQKLTPVVGHKVTVPARQYMTYFSPGALTLGTEQTDAALYTITGVGTDAVTLSDALTVASKETPLLVYNGATTEKDIFLYITAEPTTKTAHATEFKGTATDKEFSADDMSGKQYYVLAGGKMFVPVTGPGTIAAHKCWIELPNSTTARQLNIVIGDGDTTAVANSSLFTLHSSLSEWFSLDGRKLEGMPTKKGVYINGGRKVVIK